MMKRIGFPLIVIFALMILIAAPQQASARVHFGVSVGVVPAYPVYGYSYYSPYPYYYPYGYSYGPPYPYGYYHRYYWGPRYRYYHERERRRWR